MLVVKIGGAAGNDRAAFVDEAAARHRAGERLAVVHGGSDAATELGAALGHPAQFVTSPSGQRSRRTDRRTLEIFLMATALENRRLVAAFQERGVDAIGLSGIDGRVLRARRKAEIRVLHEGRQRVLRDEWTGAPEAADGALLGALLDRGLLPVLAPVGLGERGEPLNVDGDRAAAVVAAALSARALVFLTNVPGVLRDVADPTSRIDTVPQDAAAALEAAVTGSMKKKVAAAAAAVRAGVAVAVIADSRVERPIERALAGMGTVFRAAVGRSESREACA